MAGLSAYRIVETAGADAPWLTLVHGATQNCGLFLPQVMAFQEHYRLLLVDLPGHGEAANADGPFGPIEYAESVAMAMDSAAVVSTHYWGTHTGSAVALVLAHRMPERLTSLVLEGAVIPGRPLASVSECYGRARETLRERGLHAARQEWFARSAWFDVMRKNPIECRAAEHRALIERFNGAPWRDSRSPQAAVISSDELARIDVPTLLVNGEHEVADFLPAADELQACMPNASRIVVPNAGGFPLWEFPQQVNAQVQAFLRRL